MNTLCKKSIIGMFIMLFITMLAAPSPVSAASKWGFIDKILNQEPNEIARLARDLGSKAKKLPNASVLSRKLNLPKRMLVSPAVRKMALTGADMMSHGHFATNMLNHSAIPAQVLRQYSRYGKSRYIKVAETIGTTMRNSRSTISASLVKLKGKYKGMNEVINKFHAGKYDDDILVRTIRKTGKRGMFVLEWIAKHPKTAGAVAAGAWYMYDPEGFEEALHKSGKKLAAFVTESSVNISAGIGEGMSTGLSKSFSMYSIQSIGLGGLAIILALLLVFTKTCRRLLLFPFTMLGKKANAKMDALEQGSAKAGHPTHVKHSEHATASSPPRAKPKTNL